MRKILLAGVANHAFNLIVAGGFCMGSSDAVQAAEKKKYSKPPIAPFVNQMQDALLGSDKYEKPVWNLHDILDLPKWLAMSLEQRTRYETMDGTFKANGKGGDQQNFVGHQLDLSTRWDFNSSLNFETGWTHLFKGKSAKNAPSAPNAQDIDYFYVQSLLKF